MAATGAGVSEENGEKLGDNEESGELVKNDK
jgi:hypothetical protein